MKRKIKWLLLIICSFLIMQQVYSQDDIFLLVDVSGNPLNQPASTHLSISERKQAIQFVNDLLTGSIDPHNYSDWEPTNLVGKAQQMFSKSSTPVLKQGSKVFLIPYGDKLRYQDFEEFEIVNPLSDFTKVLIKTNTFNYEDQLTFEKLAIAKTVEIAKGKNIQKYLVFQICGLGGDQTASTPYTALEKQMIDDYESTTQTNSLGSFRYNKSGKNYSISIKEFDISRLLNPNRPSPGSGSSGPTIPPAQPKILAITSPSGSNETPTEFKKDETISVTWRCKGCEDNPKFILRITGIDGSNYQVSHTVISSFSKKITLPKGNYKINLSSQYLVANPVYISISSGGSGAFWFFLFIVLLIGLAIYFGRSFFVNDKKYTPRTLKKENDQSFFYEKQKNTFGSSNTKEDEYF